MGLRRIAGIAVAAAVVSGAGLLLSSPTQAATSPIPITLESTGMSSASCPLPVNGSLAVAPNAAVQFKQGKLVPGSTTESLTITPAPNSTDPTSKVTIAPIPAAGTTPITFTRTATYSLSWQFKAVDLLGLVVAKASQHGKLEIASGGCAIAVQLPVPSVSASAVPSPITSAINGTIGGVVSSVNSAVGPVNSALPSIPAVPGVPGLPSVPGLPGGGSSPGTTSTPGANAPGTSYKPTGPTVADRTVPKGYGSGSGQGGVYVPVTGNSIVAGGGQQPATGSGAGQAANPSSAASKVKSGGSPRTVELASNRPRSALGALPTLAVILAILALSGATAYYARTFLLQPTAAQATPGREPSGRTQN